MARKRSTVTPKEPESLETILGGGKGTPVWEAFWRLASTFGPAKNPAPKRSARFYAEALGRTGLIPEQIQAKAETLARSVGEPKYMPQLVTWLENGGFLNPEPQPHATPAADGIPDDRRTADVDREFLAQLKSLGA